MGEVISLPFGRRPAEPHQDMLDYPLTEVVVDWAALGRLRRIVKAFFRDAGPGVEDDLGRAEVAALREKLGVVQQEVDKGPGPRERFPFFVRKEDTIDLERIQAAFDKLRVPAGHRLDFFFDCRPNFLSGDGVFARPVVYLRPDAEPPVPLLVADLAQDHRGRSRAAVGRLDFDKDPAGHFQMALFYKLLVSPEGLLRPHPEVDWQVSVCPCRETLRGWLGNLSAAMEDRDLARLWSTRLTASLWRAGQRAMARFDSLEPNCGYFQHYAFFRNGRIAGFESLALVRVEPSIVF